LKNPEIFERISSHGQNAEEFEIKIDDSNVYLLIRNKEEIAGLYHLSPHNQQTINMHCNMLKQHRYIANDAGLLVYDWILNDCNKQYTKFITEVPQCYPEVYFYAKRFGFEDEGTNRKSVIKNGTLIDQWRVGITKQEIERWAVQH
jgi:hypothetical protein